MSLKDNHCGELWCEAINLTTITNQRIFEQGKFNESPFLEQSVIDHNQFDTNSYKYSRYDIVRTIIEDDPFEMITLSGITDKESTAFEIKQV